MNLNRVTSSSLPASLRQLSRLSRVGASAVCVAAALLLAACNDSTSPKPPDPSQPSQSPQPKTSMMPSLVTSAMAADAPASGASAAAGAAGTGNATAVVMTPGNPAPPELVARGKYLARAADCAACHTSADGAPFAGGVPLKSPFGTALLH